EIDQRDEDVDLDAKRLPGWVDDCGLRRCQEIEDADDQDEAGILEEGDEGIDQRWDHMPDRLRQNDQPVLLPIGEAESVGGFVLAALDSLQSATDDFREISASVEYDRDLGAQQFVDIDAIGHEQGKHDAGHEQKADEGNAADQFDIEHA